MDNQDFNPAKDYYTVLGVNRNASVEQLKQARSKLAFKYHPDTNRAPDSSQKFREVQDAYSVLSRPNIRQQYDIASAMQSKGKGSISYSSGSTAVHNSEDIVAGFRRNYESNIRGGGGGGRVFRKTTAARDGGDGDGLGASVSWEELRKQRRVQPVVRLGGVGALVGLAVVVFGAVVVWGASAARRVRKSQTAAVDAFNHRIREANSTKTNINTNNGLSEVIYA